MIDDGHVLTPARGFFSSLWLILKCINGKLHSDAWKIHKQVCFRKLLTEKTKTVENCTCFLSFCFLRLLFSKSFMTLFSCTDNEVALVAVRFLFLFLH